MNQKTYNRFAWSLFASSLVLAFVAWSSSLSWDYSSLSGYSLFPLFGIVAWLVMAGHYYTGVIRLRNSELKKPATYRTVTGYTVLGSLLLHPFILARELSANGLGVPPDSFVSYVGEGLKLAVMLGSFSLVLFLSFEVFERLKTRQIIKKNWWVVSLSQSLAMTLIWIHGLHLGSSLGEAWFRIIWIVLGIALIPCFYIIHKADFSNNC